MIHDLVQQIGGGYVDGLALIEGELDPHSYQLVKGDDEKLSFAQIIFSNGLQLEHGPSLSLYLSHSSKAVLLGDLLYSQDPSLIIHVNGQRDPHFWMDISLWTKTVPFIVAALSGQDPSHAEIYERNGQKLQKEMFQAHREVREIMQQVPDDKRYLVTSHDAFNYFTRAYLAEEKEQRTGEWQKRFAAPEGLAPESQLSVTDIKAIIDHLERYHIHLLFPESNVSRDSIKKIVQASQEQGLDVVIACCPLYGDAMGPSGSEGDTYLKMIRYDAETLAKHMASSLPLEQIHQPSSNQ